MKAAHFANTLGGGIYNPHLKVVVPASSKRVNIEWERSKNKIARAIGILPHPVDKKSMLWTNSAGSEQELINHANTLAPAFRDMCRDVSKKVGREVNFGPGDRCIVKAPESLHRKVAQDARVMGADQRDSLSKIGDALRGTLIVEKPGDIKNVVNEVIKLVNDQGGQVVFKNLWAEERQSGYMGVHAKILLPLAKEGPDSEKTLIVELQIHLKCIMDGTENCVKEREHLIYEHIRTGGVVNPAELSAASRLLYLTALKEYESLEQINQSRGKQP